MRNRTDTQQHVQNVLRSTWHDGSQKRLHFILERLKLDCSSTLQMEMTIMLCLSGVQTAHFYLQCCFSRTMCKTDKPVQSLPLWACLYFVVYMWKDQTSQFQFAEWEAVSHGSSGTPLSCGDSLWVPLAPLLWQRIMNFTTSAIC